MSIRRELVAGTTAVLLTAGALGAQQAAPPPQPPAPAQVRIVAPATEFEVGQTLTFKVEAFDASGAKLNLAPTAWFATPFDVGAAEMNGAVTFFEPGELTVGAIVGGKPATISSTDQAAGGRPDRRRADRAGRGRRQRPTAGAGVYGDRHPAVRCSADVDLRRARDRARRCGGCGVWPRRRPRHDHGDE